MALNFPASPALNDIHTDGDYKFQWDGNKWVSIGPEGNLDEIRTASGNNKVVVSDTDNSLNITTNSTPAVTVDSSQNVGIGTSSPEAGLHVNKTSGWAGAFYANTSTSSDPLSRGLTIGWNKSSGRGESNIVYGTDVGSLADLQISSFDGTTYTDRVTIDPDGNVGIGTTSPAGPLDVQINSTNNSRAYTSTSGTGSVFAGWNVDAGTVASGRAQLNFHHGSTNVATIYSGWNGSEMTSFDIRTFNTSDIKLRVNSTDRIRATNSGAVINGSLSKSSGSFRIDHPLPSKAATHDLVHSFVEAPDASNLYAGMVDLVDGAATVNIDTAHRMTEGTFEALNTVQSWSSSNETGYAPVKCSISGNLLTIECQDATSTDTVYYEVRGIRKDQHMLDTEWTDQNGRVITEPLKATEETPDP